MPNWIKGTMKLRGKREAIRRFFKEGLDASNWPRPEDRENQVTDESGDYYLDFAFRNEPHIVGTRRAFVTDDHAYMEDEEGVVCIDVKQAWAFDAGRESQDLETWKEISEKYNIDIKLFGVECGMRFTQEVVIIRGRKAIVNERKYEDWEWDCPFPNMGGRTSILQLKEVTMAEERYRVKTYQIDYRCDACGKGYMRSLGTVLPSCPAQYPHRCNKCGAEMNVIGRTYPYTVTEKVNE